MTKSSIAAAMLIVAGGAYAEAIDFPNIPLGIGDCPPSASTVHPSAMTSSSTTLNAGTQIFQARFDSANWNGQLLAYSLATSTSPCATTPIGAPCGAATWDAGQILNAQNSDSGRSIITYDAAAQKGIPFRWNTLNAEQQALLNANPDDPGKEDDFGALRVDYLRGSTEHETDTSTPRFRRRLGTQAQDSGGKPARASILGDIIDSNPFYVGAPAANYNFHDYAGFHTGHATRTPMVYVGANDGMLHGFNAKAGAQDGGGRELLAYVPNTVFGTPASETSPAAPQLSRLTSPSYHHTFMVDGDLAAGDACWGGTEASCWHTVLAGGLGAGGRALYALDVTDPSRFQEGNADALVLWEFTHRDNPDLGYTLGQPAIVRMANDRWAVVIGNGYDSTGASGRAALFILFVDHDKTHSWNGDYIEIPVNTPSGFAAPNGLATPAAADTDGDGYIDTIYAGDLAGDLWKFDVASSDPSRWKVAYGGKPLFVATDAAGNRQPITERPNVGYNLLTPSTSLPHDVIVYFGTGRYFDAHDATSTGINTFYGVFDESWSELPSITRDVLLQQTVVREISSSGSTCAAGPDCYRVTSSSAYNAGLTGQYGWYIDLASPDAAAGRPTERQITNPLLYGGKVIFTTLIPAASGCNTDASGWLMELAAGNGGAAEQPALDINRDNTVDDRDHIATSEKSSIPSGVGTAAGVMSAPQLEISPRADDGTDHLLTGVETNGDSGGTGIPPIDSRAERSGAARGRISWREIAPP
jgi:type IV pilus assembly protein PilY1